MWAGARTHADRVAEILDEIRSDIASGTVNGAVRSFSDLYAYVDANEYLIANGRCPDPEAVEDLDTRLIITNAVSETVDAALARSEHSIDLSGLPAADEAALDLVAFECGLCHADTTSPESAEIINDSGHCPSCDSTVGPFRWTRRNGERLITVVVDGVVHGMAG